MLMRLRKSQRVVADGNGELTAHGAVPCAHLHCSLNTLFASQVPLPGGPLCRPRLHADDDGVAGLSRSCCSQWRWSQWS